MRGEKDRCLKKGRVLNAVAAPARRAMKSMPGREGSWEENFIFALPERVEVCGLSRSGQECCWGEEKASVVAVRDFPITRGCIKTRCFDTASL